MLKTTNNHNERGAILLIVLIVVFIIAGVSAALLGQVQVNATAVASELENYQAFEVAEAGVAEAMADIFSGNGPTATGTATRPVTNFNGGSYQVTLDSQWGAGDDRVTVTSVGTFNNRTETITAEFTRQAAEIAEPFLKAVYAGNTSEVPPGTDTFSQSQKFNYQAKFGGGVDALDTAAFDGDLVDGDTYIAGNIFRNQQARLNGEVKGPGNLALGKAGASQHTRVVSQKYVKPPNLQGMNYEQIADFKVDSTNTNALYKNRGFSNGKTALKQTGTPYHILTKNRTDMSTENNSTPQDDYYLEDVVTDSERSKDDQIDPGVTDKIIYIEGNLWIHNKRVIEFEWAKNTRLTIVVKGSIYISDDIRYNGPSGQHARGTGDANSMVAFIALKDSNYPNNSGDIIMGDPRYGTVDYMDGVFYAENNFKDQNLSSAGAATFEIFGGMLAGNQVDINRDFYKSYSSTEYVPTRGNVYMPKGHYHSEMNVIFDTRLLDPNFKKPPGLPTPEGGTPAGAWIYLGWRRGN